MFHNQESSISDEECHLVDAVAEAMKSEEIQKLLSEIDWDAIDEIQAQYEEFIEWEEKYKTGLNQLGLGLIQESYIKFQLIEDHPAAIVWLHWMLSQQFDLKVEDKANLKKVYETKIIELYEHLEQKSDSCPAEYDLRFCTYWCHESGMLGEIKKQESSKHCIEISDNVYYENLNLLLLIRKRQPDVFTQESLIKIDELISKNITLNQWILDKNISKNQQQISPVSRGHIFINSECNISNKDLNDEVYRPQFK